jgi:hypothetical protein
MIGNRIMDTPMTASEDERSVINSPARSHMGSVPKYRCERCGVNFLRVANYNRHNQSSKCGSNSSIYPCRFTSCGGVYNRKDNRDKHEREKHGVGPQQKLAGPGKLLNQGSPLFRNYILTSLHSGSRWSLFYLFSGGEMVEF